MLPNKKKYQYFFVTILCLVCYGYSLNGDYVFDDSVAIVRNYDVTNLNSINVSNLFEHDFWGYNLTDTTSHKSYRPLTVLMFRIEHYLFGLNPFYMKCINLFLHVLISCGLIEFYTGILEQGESIPQIGAILFAIHPIHTEAVSGIVGRAELMVAISFLMVFWIYIKIIKATSKTNQILLFIPIFIITTLSILFKENGITLLPFLIIYDVIKNFNFKKFYKFTFLYIRIIFLFTFTLILIYLRLKIMNYESPKFKKMDNPVAANDNLQTRILTQNYLYSLNFWLLMCPDWLSFDWALGSLKLVESFRDVRLIGTIVFYLMLVGMVWVGNKKIYLGLSLMIVPFIPASGIIKVGFVIAERILYLPSIGYCLLIGIGLKQLSQKFNKTVIKLIFLIISIVLVLKTITRANEWRTEDTLFRSALRVCPNNAKVYYNIARLATDNNKKAMAFEYYHKAIALYPEYESAIMNLGNLYREMGDFRKAEIYLKKSVEILEEFPAAWMNLGIVQASLKNYNESLKCYTKALKYRKRYPVCLYNLGNLYIELKNDTMAMKYWKESIQLDPKQNKAWANILALFDNKNQINEVIDISKIALTYNPSDPAILFTRANAFGKLGDFNESEKIFKEIITLRPNYALYHANLGVLYHRWNKYDEASQSYREALRLDPHLKSAHDNLIKLRNKENVTK